MKALSRCVLTVFAVGLLCMSQAGMSAPKSTLWAFWNVSDEQSTNTVSHAIWQSMLDDYLHSDHVSGVNRFDYASVSPADKEKLDAYLNALQKIDPRTLNRAEQQAYWINLYNAKTVGLVLQKYPVDSIRDIRFLSSWFGPWDKKNLKVVGQSLSLNDIEHRILRPIWQDQRIHFVVNCASIGCPNLSPIAFTAENIDRLMDLATLNFINHPRAVKVQQDTLVLSSIFDWYSVDFGNSEDALIEFLSAHLGSLEVIDMSKISRIRYQYDWALNRP